MIPLKSKPYSEYTKDDLMYLLESLTPTGSEFYHEPATCVNWVNDRLHSLMKVVKERNALRDQVYHLQEEMAEIKEQILER